MIDLSTLNWKNMEKTIPFQMRPLIEVTLLIERLYTFEF